MKEKRKLKDHCAYCDELVWQYDETGKGFCEMHARWKHMEMRREKHPLDVLHPMSVLSSRVDHAGKRVVGIIKRIGYAEAFLIAERLGFESGVQWWDEKLYLRLSDLQLIAFAAAMSAHFEAVYPKRTRSQGAKEKRSTRSRTSLRS